MYEYIHIKLKLVNINTVVHKFGSASKHGSVLLKQSGELIIIIKIKI